MNPCYCVGHERVMRPVCEIHHGEENRSLTEVNAQFAVRREK